MVELKILIAVDDSEYSQAALDSVVSRTWETNTEFTVMNVVEPAVPEYAAWHMTYTPVLYEAIAGRVGDAQNMVNDRVSFLKEKLPGCKVQGDVIEGPIRHSIWDKAKNWQADFIIMGSHGRTGIAKFLMGSVSESVAKGAPCSIEIIHKHTH